ncbi:MAG: M23 family metallopeptidase [Chloroflexi bacterium]|uniref:M23 family metallopeptidase n=1 Tax=Candidatus Chlorohelix allophototropha TaxID=3003348 RepID=A0A8T7MAL1_9CHLR|nr:M23 family metallopeptidase [Chloroflexota bacterium]WJW69022.1 M23 family metallopeptidase [Chloroflexota bacterium L227-S17]
MPANNKKKKTRSSSGPSQEERRRKAANKPLGGSGPPPGYESKRGAYSSGGTNYNAGSKRLVRTMTIVMAIIMLVALLGSTLAGCLETRAYAQEAPPGVYAAPASSPPSYTRLRYLTRTETETPQTASLPAPTTSLPDNTLYVGETGHFLMEPFLSYWQTKGGSNLLGNPISEQFAQNGLILQYFERVLLDYNPQATSASPEVVGGFLGKQLVEAKGLSFAPITDSGVATNRVFFKETSHSLSGSFKTYWDKNEGLTLLGFPISEPFDETSGLTVQYFERGRLESISGGNVHLSNAGDLLFTAKGWAQPLKLPLDLNIADTEIYQGRTLSIRLSNDGKWLPIEVKGKVGDTELKFANVSDVYKAFYPVDPRIDPKTYTMALDFSDLAGRARRISQPITVVKYDFPLQRLYLPSDKSITLDAEVEAAEDKQVAFLNNIFTPQPLWSGLWGLPSPNANPANITTEFAQRRAYNDSPNFDYYHGGIDYAESLGTPIFAPAAGKVVYTNPDLQVRGGTVAIDHGLGIISYYYHMSAIIVQKDQMVKPGDVLGRVGNTGRSSGPHLHWEVRVNGIITDPRLFQKQDLSK